MKRISLKSLLETLTSIAVLVVSGLIVWSIVHSWIAQRTFHDRLEGMSAGAVVPALEGVSYKDSPTTLLLGLDAHCRICGASTSFYRTLTTEARRRHTQIVAFFPNSSEEVKTYLRNGDLDLKTIPQASFVDFGIKNTPTLLLVDQNGKLVDSWVGQLSEPQEKQLISMMGQ